LGSRATARAKEARANESATTATPLGTSPENARTRTRARARAEDFKENVSNCGEMCHPARECPENKGAWVKGGYRGTRSKGGYVGEGKGIWQVDADDAQGYFDWSQPEEEKPTSNEANVGDQDGHQAVKRNRVLGNYTPDIFTLDRLTDRKVEIGQILTGSTGSRIKASSTCCSSVSACITGSVGLCSARRIMKGDVSQDHWVHRGRSTWRSTEVISRSCP
jgi:hypothetical protein